MKNLTFLTFAAFLILAACSKSDRFDSGQNPEGMNKMYPQCSHVVTIAPNQDGDGDDTEELNAAISGAEPGTMIKLLTGVYHVGYIELYDFHGVITGMGCEKTTVVLLPPLNQLSQINNNQTSGWWRVIGGDLTLSGITFKTPDGFLSYDGDYNPDWGSDLYSMFMVNQYNDIFYYPEGSPQKLFVKGCNFIGGVNPDMTKDGWWKTDHNVWIAFWIGVDYTWPREDLDYPLTKGNYIFQDCKFDHLLDGVEGFSLGEEATMTVADCRLNNCMWPLYFTANYNSRINITGNLFTNSREYDILIEDMDYGFIPNTVVNDVRRATYTISGNKFNESTISSICVRDNWVAIDPEARLPMLITIKNNKFNLSGTGSGISALNSQDIIISHNSIKGECSYGILVDGVTIFDAMGTEYPAPFADKALIRGNYFSGLTSTSDIYLGEKSSNCLVIGSETESVIDNGTDNKIVAMHHKYGGYHSAQNKRNNYTTFHGFRHH